MSQLIYAIRGWTFSFLSSSPTRSSSSSASLCDSFFLCETFTDRPTWSSGSDRCVCQHSPTTTESLCHTKASQVYMLGNGIIADLLLPARSVVCRNEWDSRWNILSRAEDLNARFGRLRFLLMKQFFLLLDDICWLVWILEEFFIVYSVFSSSSLSAFFLTSAHTMFFFYFAFIHLLLFAAWHI